MFQLLCLGDDKQLRSESWSLKYYRKLNGLSVNDVSAILKKNHFQAAPKTIYGWESGNTQPDADTLMILCEIYHIENVLEAFGYQQPSKEDTIQLTDHERKLILKYRQEKEMQPAVDRLLNL